MFLDFSTVGPGVDTSRIDAVVDATYYDVTVEDRIVERLHDCEVALLNKTRIAAPVFGQLPALRLVSVAATGVDNVDSAAAKAAGVAVANVRDYCSDALAQHVFALILGITQQIGLYSQLVQSGAWSQSRSFALFDYPIRELAGRNLGIVGFGYLGRAVARVARGFGMNVLVAARPGSGEVPPGRLPFDEVLARADVLSLHCPLTEATTHLLDADAFHRMKSDAILINTARGGLVDQAALADALRRGEIAGAGIDVLPVEPPPADDPLLAGDIPNLVVTPHIAWAAREARQRAIDQLAENIESFFAGGELRRVV